MPLHRITHLKAPWPAGAVVGDVIELDTVPAWAAGKCAPAPEADAPTVLTDEQRAHLEREREQLAEATRLELERIEQERQAVEAEALRQQQEAEAAQRAAEAAAAQAAAAQQADKPADPAPAEKPAKGKAK